MAKMRGSNVRFAEAASARALASGRDAVIIVDAILGTGFAGEVRGIYRDAIEWINRQEAFVASVDVPSGVNATTGEVQGAAVRAHLTVTMGLGKIGLYVGAGADMSGEVRIADISIPPVLFRPGGEPVYRVHAGDVQAVLPLRSRTAHKYSVGKVLVIGGSRNFTGAPMMTAQTALRSGAGAVVLAIPRSVHTAVARRLTEVIIAPQEETARGALSQEAAQPLLERAAWADAVALGPGLSRDEETMALVLRLAAEIRKPLIIDADALFALAGHTGILKKRKHDTILTPHAGEFSILADMSTSRTEEERVEAPRRMAKTWQCTVVLKGAPTVTAEPDGTVYLNSSGNPGMATIGSGDVLTGLIAGLRAQGVGSGAAAYAGVFLHGLAGDLAAAKHGQRSMVATDILESVPQAMGGHGG
jgi:NAD(P)H-hydrate epimerase